MNNNFMALAGVAVAMLMSLTPGLGAPGGQAASVKLKDGKVVHLQGGNEVVLTQNITLAEGLQVSTNGTFRVGGGKERKLKEGQSLNKDGLLTSPDGSVMPVWDHLTMRQGALVQVKDGEASPVTTHVQLPDGTRIGRDGTMRLSNGHIQRFLDGQIMRMDGKIAGATDSATLKDGKVTVQKDGSQFAIRREQSIMMNEGTRIFGDGTLISRDGKKSRLQDGEVRTFEGAK